MAERRSARGKQDLTPDELAPAPDERGDALTIVGVLGDSTDADSVRLFLDAQFQTYYEIPREAIVRRTRVPAERSPLGVDASAVVVRKGTELTAHRAETRRVEEEFLAGDFTAPGTFTPTGPPVPPLQVTRFCPSRVLVCPTRSEECITGIVGCPGDTRTTPGCISRLEPCITHDPACFAVTQEPRCFITRELRCWVTRDPEACVWVTRDPGCFVTRDPRCFTRDPACLVSRGLACVTRICPSQVDGCPTAFCDPGTGDPGPIVR